MSIDKIKPQPLTDADKAKQDAESNRPGFDLGGAKGKAPVAASGWARTRRTTAKARGCRAMPTRRRESADGSPSGAWRVNWQGMLFQDWEGVVRTLFVGVLAYVVLVVFLRISGKRTLAKPMPSIWS